MTQYTEELVIREFTELDTVESCDSFNTILYAHEYDEGKWEYAAIRWRWKVPILLWVLRDGQLIYSEDG